LYATRRAIALLEHTGSVWCWGMAHYGGDCSRVWPRLRSVRQIAASGGAFAALCVDGTVVTWGAPDCGGDSSSVQEQLQGVQALQASTGAFAA
ncbi:HERC1, partial [Symbiodinium necroappetens]